MALSHISFDNLSERDLLEQIQAGVPEGVLVEYKRNMYGRADADVKEFLKDVSSFANTLGGDLIIGVDETDGVPTSISALSGNSDQELQRLENLARDGIEPCIAGLRMKAVPITTGGFVVVLRIPRSFNPPHRVSTRNTNRIYGRNSAGVYEFSVEELRVVFTSAASALDRVRAFRAERLARIDAGDAIVSLVDGSRLVLHLVPISAFGLGGQIDLERVHAAQEQLRPIDSMGLSPRINFDALRTCTMGMMDDVGRTPKSFEAARLRL
jgi:Putative DNA-binding domain